MIIEHVWDQSFDGMTNIVDVYVRHLRMKLDDPYPDKMIRTVRGAGYMIHGAGER
jgi:two-component system copper resistance phosphate regulon response regulator CusR